MKQDFKKRTSVMKRIMRGMMLLTKKAGLTAIKGCNVDCDTVRLI